MPVIRTVVPEHSEFDLSFEVDTDLSARQYTFVSIDTNNQAADPAAGEACPGILQDAPNGSSVLKVGTVRVGGVSKLKLAGSVVAGDYIKTDNSGAGVKATVNKDNVCAQALSDGSSGDLIAVRIVCAVTNI